MKFIATADSVGAKFYRKGEVYEFVKDAPSKHFEPLTGPAPVKPVAKPEVIVPMSYAAMTVAELAAVAEEKGVEIHAKWNKDKIIEALVAADVLG